MTRARKVPLDTIAPEPEAPGIASSAHEVNGTRWAVVTYEPGVLREEFCDEGHSGYVLEGDITYEFGAGDPPLHITAGQGFVLAAGPDGEHRGRAGEGGARLFLIDREA